MAGMDLKKIKSLIDDFEFYAIYGDSATEKEIYKDISLNLKLLKRIREKGLWEVYGKNRRT